MEPENCTLAYDPPDEFVDEREIERGGGSK
jgi:hypothetical protein